MTLAAHHDLAAAVESRPPPPTPTQTSWIGQYGRGDERFDVFERDARLMVMRPDTRVTELRPFGGDRYYLPLEEGARGDRHEQITFATTEEGRTRLSWKRWRYPRRDYGAEAIAIFQSSLSPMIAMPTETAKPPASSALRPDLVPVSEVAPGIRTDMRYATADNFLGFPVYNRPEAYLHLPVAEALGGVDRALGRLGYGLVVHDAYRPWSVTKLFWDNVPEPFRSLVADPSLGSVHNRGCAVDVTLWDRETGDVVEMPGRYDEPSPRSARDYFGGSSQQRWLRDLLGVAMARGGFAGHSEEWWHFDYRGWERVAVENVPLEDL